MIEASQLRKGHVIELDGKLYRCWEQQLIKMGRGGANVKTKLRDLLSGSIIERTFGCTIIALQKIAVCRLIKLLRVARCSIDRRRKRCRWQSGRPRSHPSRHTTDEKVYHRSSPEGYQGFLS